MIFHWELEYQNYNRYRKESGQKFPLTSIVSKLLTKHAQCKVHCKFISIVVPCSTKIENVFDKNVAVI